MKVERINVPTTRKVGDLNIGDGFVVAYMEYLVVDLCNSLKEICDSKYVYALNLSSEYGPMLAQFNRDAICIPTKLKIETN